MLGLALALALGGCAAPQRDDGSRWDPVPTGAATAAPEADRGAGGQPAEADRQARRRERERRQQQSQPQTGFEVAAGALPPGFPGEVPVVEGTILQGIQGPGRLYGVMVSFDGSADEAREAVRRSLRQAGFVEEEAWEMSATDFGVSFAGAGLEVSASIAAVGTSTLISYGIEPTDAVAGS